MGLRATPCGVWSSAPWGLGQLPVWFRAEPLGIWSSAPWGLGQRLVGFRATPVRVKGGGDTPLRPGSSSKTRFDTGA